MACCQNRGPLRCAAWASSVSPLAPERCPTPTRSSCAGDPTRDASTRCAPALPVLRRPWQGPHRPDLRLAIGLFATRRGQRKPSQWFQDTQENCALWWWGLGMHPARSCWYEFRDRLGHYLETCNARPCPCTMRRNTPGSPVDCHRGKEASLKGLSGPPSGPRTPRAPLAASRVDAPRRLRPPAPGGFPPPRLAPPSAGCGCATGCAATSWCLQATPRPSAVPAPGLPHACGASSVSG
jgi:hypothetical protein